eukprot:11516274-Alexandrium_andersonii.AAC.1
MSGGKHGHVACRLGYERNLELAGRLSWSSQRVKPSYVGLSPLCWNKAPMRQLDCALCATPGC